MPENELEVTTEMTDVSAEPEMLAESVEETAEHVEPTPIPDDYELICARERADREYDEFRSLFPDMSLAELPDSVIEGVRSGIPLCAACALHELRRERDAKSALLSNAENSERAFPLDQSMVNEGWLSPDEVREMTPSEVRTNYKKIIESMYHWN